MSALTSFEQMKSKQTLRVVRDGNVIIEETLEGAAPEIHLRDSSALSDMSRMLSIRAGSCIYCSSAEQLSREHVAPYALGGTLTILEGSCEACRRKTHAFETDVLTGPMRMVRYIQKMPSSTKHRSVRKAVPLLVTHHDDSESQISVPIEKAPIFLVFYEFGEPKYLQPSRGDNLETGAIVTGSYGHDPEEVLRDLDAQGMSVTPPPARPVAFARMMAKIAYCFAYIKGHVGKLDRPEELVRAFMDEPDTIGRFVGSIPPPFVRYEGVSLRLAIKVLETERIVYSEVQLFAASGAPTYVVVLGRLKDGEVLTEDA